MLYLDTYALLAWIDGAPPYARIAKAATVTHDMNLLEAASKLLQRGDKDPWSRLDALGVGVIGHDRHDLRTAALLKADKALRGRNLSYVDALGYALSLRIRVPFLTGDRGFQGLPGVEFLPARP